jgi:hypothetical protein
MTQHETSQPSARKDGSFASLCSGLRNLGAVLILALLMLTAVCSAHAQILTSQTSVGARPYMGWSTWTLQDKFDTYPFGGNTGSGEPYGDGYQNEWNIRAQSDAMKSTGLQAAGFEYINIDGDWDNGQMCQCGVPITWDAYGRPTNDPVRFPSGMAALAAYIHGNGQKAGIYLEPGIPPQVYAANPPILGTTYHVQDIAMAGLPSAWNSYIGIDYTKPGAQAFVTSIIQLFAQWGYDYVKVDGTGDVTSASNSSTGLLGVPVYLRDVQAVHNAVKAVGRPMYVNLSSALDHNYAGWFERYTNGRRIDGDIECSSSARRPNAACANGAGGGNGNLAPLTDWANVPAVTSPLTPPNSGVVIRFTDLLNWQNDTGVTKGWNDFDTLAVGNGTNVAYPSTNKEKLVQAVTPNPAAIPLKGLPTFVDGLTNTERQTTMTLWSIAGSALQLGDDMTNLDAFGISILTNPEVIAVDQSGRQAHYVYLGGVTPIVSGKSNATTVTTSVVAPGTTTAIGATPVIAQTLCDGSLYVALFNTSASTETVSVNWVDLGLPLGTNADVRDLWARDDLGSHENSYSVSLPSHGSSLVHVTPARGTALTANLLDDSCVGNVSE